MATPGTNPERIIQLDALRGVAVIGIVWMNVYAFALPAQAYYNPVALAGVGAAGNALDRLIWIVSFVFIEDKFRTLFAMMFGAGCLILVEKAAHHRWRAHFSRMAVLFAIGLAHSVLLASNDVLRIYALAGLALPFLAHLKAPQLYAVAIGLLVLHFAGAMMLFGGAMVDFFAGRFGSDAYLVAERRFGHDEAALRSQLAIGSEGLGERIARRIDDFGAQMTMVAAAIPLNLAAMALGMALWKQRMFAGEWRTFMLQRIAAICAAISIPVLMVLAWWVAKNGFPGALVAPAALMFSAPFDTLLGLAYAALAMAFLAENGAVTKRLAMVGRLSLTNYLMTSIILAAIFASWGLGLFGSVSRVQSFAISFIPIVAMLVWSPFWLAKFGQGPVERAWRWSSAKLS